MKGKIWKEDIPIQNPQSAIQLVFNLQCSFIIKGCGGAVIPAQAGIKEWLFDRDRILPLRCLKQELP